MGKLGERQIEVYGLFQDKEDPEEWLTVNQVADRCGISRQMAERILESLFRRGLLDWNFGDQGWVYNLAE